MVLRWGGRRATEPLGRDLVAWLSPDALGGSSNGDVAFGETLSSESARPMGTVKEAGMAAAGGGNAGLP